MTLDTRAAILEDVSRLLGAKVSGVRVHTGRGPSAGWVIQSSGGERILRRSTLADGQALDQWRRINANDKNVTDLEDPRAELKSALHRLSQWGHAVTGTVQADADKQRPAAADCLAAHHTDCIYSPTR
jgi:hypothetical protein